MADPRLQPVISNESGAKSINQLVYRDQGRSEYSAPIAHTGYNSSSYARTVKNIGSGGNVEHWLTSTGNLLLTANDTGLSVGVGLTLPFMTTGSIPYIGASGLITQDNANLFYDGPNKRLGIGTGAAPTATLSIGSAGFIRFTVDGATGNVVIGASKLTVDGSSGDLTINTNKFSVAGATGAIVGASTLITGNTIAPILGTLTGGNVANWSGSATWNNGATQFIADFLEITDTASAANSLLALWRVGVVPKFQVDKTGLITTTGQIAFPSTQNPSSDANTLDDYKESTWTPSVGGTATYITQTGTYTKIGRLVFWRLTLTINAIGTGSQTTVSGLPFTPAVNTAGEVSSFDQIASSVVLLKCNVNTSSNIVFRGLTAANTSTTTLVNIFQNLANVQAAGVYEI